MDQRIVPAVVIRFDYSLDSAGFFQGPARRVALETAATQLTAPLQDSLAEIVPAGRNQWTATVQNPATGSTVELPNLRVGANELVVFVNSGLLGPGELGLANTGGYTASGTPSWLATVQGRGQAGALATDKTDYSTWGGLVTFDADTAWSFRGTGPAANEFDFQTVATHELMHLLGFGLGEPAFTRHVAGGRLNGPQVRAVTGGAGAAVVGTPLPDHFAPGTAFAGQASPMQPTLPAGVRRPPTALDYAALDDIGWEVGATRPAAQATAQAASVESTPAVAVPQALRAAFAVGGATEARLMTATGQTVMTLAPFGPQFTGGVRVVLADVTGNGVPDLVAGTGPGVTAELRVFDGQTGQLIASARPFEAAFTGGINLAAADLTGDGRAEVVVTPDVTGGPVVSVYAGDSLAAGGPQKLAHFWGMNDPAYRGGLRPALGDLNGDGVADLALGAGAGGGPRVAVLDGTAVRANAAVSLAPDFFAFDPASRGGAAVAFADATGDGRLDLVTGAGAGSAPRLTTYAGPDLLQGVARPVSDVFVGDPSSRTGVRLASADLTGSARRDVLASAGSRMFAYHALPGLPLAAELPTAGLAELGTTNVG